MQDFTTIYNQYCPEITRYVKGHVPPSAVEDIVQEVFLDLSELNPQPGNVSAWLDEMAKRKIADFLQHAPAQVANTMSPDLSFYVSQLPEPSREVASLLYLRSYTLRQIANHLELSSGIVFQRVCEAARQLRGIMGVDA